MSRALLILLLLLAVALPLSAVQRHPMLELFTSTTCGPCAAGNPIVSQSYANHEQDIVIVRYHMNWPAPGNDPFWLADTAENYARRMYYSVSGIPDLVVDGMEQDTFWWNHIEDTISARMAVDAPCSLGLDVSSPGRIIVTVVPTDSSFVGHWVLQTIVIEDSIYYTGPNGDPRHDQVMRDMLRTPAGPR